MPPINISVFSSVLIGMPYTNFIDSIMLYKTKYEIQEKSIEKFVWIAKNSFVLT